MLHERQEDWHQVACSSLGELRNAAQGLPESGIKGREIGAVAQEGAEQQITRSIANMLQPQEVRLGGDRVGGGCRQRHGVGNRRLLGIGNVVGVGVGVGIRVGVRVERLGGRSRLAAMVLLAAGGGGLAIALRRVLGLVQVGELLGADLGHAIGVLVLQQLELFGGLEP